MSLTEHIPGERESSPRTVVPKYEELRQKCNKMSPEEREKAFAHGMRLIYGEDAMDAYERWNKAIGEQKMISPQIAFLAGWESGKETMFARWKYHEECLWGLGKTSAL